MTVEEADALDPKPDTEYVFATMNRFEQNRTWVKTDRENETFVFSRRLPNGKTVEDRRAFKDLAYLASRDDYEICKAKMKEYTSIKEASKHGAEPDLTGQRLAEIAGWLKQNYPLFVKWQKLCGRR